MNVIPLTIESLVSILLLFTILYCVRLNSQLKRLKADESAMRATIGDLMTATESAERAIAGLKNTMREAEEKLGDHLVAAERFCTDIAVGTEAGNEVLGRLAQIAGAARPGGPVAVAEAKPAAPDPKAIMAAAQAFTERAKARIKGLAA